VRIAIKRTPLPTIARFVYRLTARSAVRVVPAVVSEVDETHSPARARR
jgi:hypothetical protein